jgi:hypothetical protein
VHAERRIPANEHAGRACVIEVDVREDEVAQILDAEPVGGEARLERAEAGRGPAVDERRLIPRQEVGPDDPGAPEVLQVEKLRGERAT